MNKINFFFTPGKAAFGVGGALTLGGCVGFVYGLDMRNH